jgi:hypothetical protein
VSHWTHADVARVLARHTLATLATAPAPRRKYGNTKTTIDKFTFDSKKEAEFYLLLKMRERLKEIDHLELQPVFELYVEPPGRGRIHVGDFTPDFRYWERLPDGGETLRVVDVKSEPTKTEAYRLRKKLAEAIYGIEVIEV